MSSIHGRMSVGELRKRLEGVSDDAEVVVDVQYERGLRDIVHVDRAVGVRKRDENGDYTADEVRFVCE